MIAILAGTGLAYLLGAVQPVQQTEPGRLFESYGTLFGQLSWSGIGSLVFWIAVFLLLLIVVFENIGLIAAQTRMIGRPGNFKGSLRALALTNIVAGVFGSSPMVASAEISAGIAAGQALRRSYRARYLGRRSFLFRCSPTFRTARSPRS